MSNGDKEVKRTDGEEPLGATLKPKTERPDTSLNPNIDNTKGLTKTDPEFRAQNPYHVKQKLINNNELLEDTASKYFSSQFSDREWQELQKEPEKLKKNYNLFKKNFRKDLVESSYAGETPDQTLVRRSIELTDSPESVPTNEYIDTMRNNPKKYKKMGYIGDDGEPIFGEDETTLASEIAANPELHKALQQDRYEDFQEQLSKEHNMEGLVDNPAERTKAWIVYDKLGKEGLTKYINAKETLEGGSIADSFSERQKAAQWLQNVDVGGKTLQEHYKEFVVGKVKDVKYGGFIAEYSYKNNLDPALVAGVIRQESNFNPNAESSAGAVGLMQIMPKTGSVDLGIDPSERTDPETSIRGGTEYLSRLMKRYDGNEQYALAAYNAGMGNVDKAIKKAKEQGGNWKEYLPKPEETVPYIDKVQKYRDQYRGQVDGGLVFRPREKRDDLKKDFPKDLNPFTVDIYDKNGKVKKLKTTIGEYAAKYLPKEQTERFNKTNFTRDGVFSEEYTQLAQAVYSKHKTKDLLDTVIANAETNGKYENGTQYFQIDYEKLDWPQKLAFNALKTNPNSDELFREMGEGKYQIIPDYQKLSSDIWGKARSFFYNTETEIAKDEQGNIIFKERPDTGWFAQIQNAAVNTAFAGANMATKYITAPLSKGIDYVADTDWSRELKESQEILAASHLSGLSNSQDDGWLPNAAEEVAPFGWYLAGMLTSGGIATKVAGKAMQLATKGKAAVDAARTAGALSGASRWSRIGQRLGSAANPTGRLYAGGVAMESLSRDQDSFYNVLPQLLGYDDKNAVSQYYNEASGWTKTAMDALGSLAIDFGFDTLIAGSRFMKDKAAQKFFGKNQFESYQFKPEVKNGKVTYTPIMKDTPQFKHEIKRFISELTNGLAAKPIGNVGDSMGKRFVGTGADQIKTLHDAVKKWGDDLGGFVGGIKSDIKENIRAIEAKYQPSVRLSDEQLDEIAETQYQNFVTRVGDQMAGILKTSDDEQLAVKFADALEQQMPTTKEFTVAGKKVRPAEVDHYRQRGHSLVVKNGKVYEIDPKFWAVDIAQRIRQRGLQVRAEDVAERKLRARGIDPDNPKSGKEVQTINEVKNEARRVIGTYTANKRMGGYVVDFDDSGYTVRTPQGTAKVKQLSSPLPKEPARNVDEVVPDAEFKQFVDTGQVQPQRIEAIADRVRQGEDITPREYDIMNANSAEVENVLRQRKNAEFTLKARDEHTQAMVRQFKQYSEELDRISKSSGDRLPFCK